MALLEVESFKGSILEPCCGSGAISAILKRELDNHVRSQDLHDHGYGTSGIDFLSFEGFQFGNVITNPPYRYAQEFVERSLDMADNKVAMLLKIQFLEGARRRGMFERTPLKTVHVFSKRLKIYKEGMESKSSTMMCFAWFVWDHAYRGPATINWI